MAIPVIPTTSMTLIFGRPYKIGTRKGFISFDLILSESHSISNTISEHPVEDGSVISDHIKNNLENGSLTGLISNFSLSTFTSFTNRAQDAYDEIVRLWKNRETVTLVSVLRTYNDIAIVDVNVSLSADTGSAIVLDISFKQIKKVKLKTVLIDVGVNIKDTKTDIKRQSSPALDQGRTIGASVS